MIVTSYESPEILRLCLESLTTQCEAEEIVVSDCSRIDPALTLQQVFPKVRFLHFEPQSVPQLRWAAVAHTTGEFVAATEARCVPSATWCRDLLTAHRSAPECPAVGGTVAVATEASSFDFAIFLCEYSAYTPPVREGLATTISGANLSYRRSALMECLDDLDRGEWETSIHRKWITAGNRLWQSNACVRFKNSMTPRSALCQRWHYGRGYAADRVAGKNWSVRFGFGVASLGLPLLLTGRIAVNCARKGLLPRFMRAIGWVLALTFAWSWGETAGYLGPKPTLSRIF